MLSDRELQTLFNWGHLGEEAANEIAALRAALAAQPAEPVAIAEGGNLFWIVGKKISEDENVFLYAAPPTPAAVPPGYALVEVQAMSDELDLLQSITKGYPMSMAQADAKRAISVLRAMIAAGDKP